jgi:hypothetical protein
MFLMRFYLFYGRANKTIICIKGEFDIPCLTSITRWSLLGKYSQKSRGGLTGVGDPKYCFFSSPSKSAYKGSK